MEKYVCLVRYLKKTMGNIFGFSRENSIRDEACDKATQTITNTIQEMPLKASYDVTYLDGKHTNLKFESNENFSNIISGCLIAFGFLEARDEQKDTWADFMIVYYQAMDVCKSKIPVENLEQNFDYCIQMDDGVLFMQHFPTECDYEITLRSKRQYISNSIKFIHDATICDRITTSSLGEWRRK